MKKQDFGELFPALLFLCYLFAIVYLFIIAFYYVPKGPITKAGVTGAYLYLKYILMIGIFLSAANWLWRVAVRKNPFFKASGIWHVIIFAAGFHFSLNVPLNNLQMPAHTQSSTRSLLSTQTQSSTRSQSSTAITSPTTGIVATQISSKDFAGMVYVPAGEFLMGSDKSVDSQAFDNELPQYTVTLDVFWIDQTEVTNAMYTRCVSAWRCTKPHDITSTSQKKYYGDSHFAHYPVIWVDWNQANAYCDWAGRRLPTAAEWEKAARGADGRIYPWGNKAPSCNLANTSSCVDDTASVGSYPAGASPYGALDMAGNVGEWVADWYSGTYYQNSPTQDPKGPASGQYRMIRGGSWVSLDQGVRSARRSYTIPDNSYYDIGFRCATSP